MLCIRWDCKGVLYYEPLQPNGTVTGDRGYSVQLIRLSDAIEEKQPFTRGGRRSIKLHRNNGRSRFHTSVKDTLLPLSWEILKHSDHASENFAFHYHLFRPSLVMHITDEERQKWIDEFITSAIFLWHEFHLPS